MMYVSFRCNIEIEEKQSTLETNMWDDPNNVQK